MKGSQVIERWRHFRPRRTDVLAGGAATLACLGYFGMLWVLDSSAEAYFEDLRQSNPALYLTQLRESEGFEAFLAEYRVLEGYETFHPSVPSFLVGRWTMRSAPIRLVPGTAPAECTDPVTFDYGLFLQVESGGVALAVNYLIEGNTVQMRTGNTGVVPIELVSYGAQLDHIVFVPPGATEPVDAYLCGR